MSDVSKAKALCVVCAQPARLTCVCKTTRYCSVLCQKDHWKNQGHREECKELVEANAASAVAESESGAPRGVGP